MSLRLLILLGIFSLALPAQTKLLRFPDIHGDRVVFVYAGDLWSVAAEGGSASRLTAHPGLELFPKFSPDGASIAFTGQYDGDEQVYVIPAGGGEPKQLTFYPARGPLAPRWGYDHQVYGWSPDGKSVLFRSTREYWGPAEGRLYTVSTEGGLPEALPMPVSGAGDLSPDGKGIAYSPLFRDFRTWKRYQGGWAQDIYVFYPSTQETEQVTKHERTDRDPMWVGDKIYFASDRDGKLNLYSYDSKSKKTDQATKEKVWDVRWPSSDGKQRIVYELNGELQVLDARSGKSKAIAIQVPDDGIWRRPRRISAEKHIESYELSPKGERALFVARGDLFTAPIEKGPTRNLTNTPNAHERGASWSPNGKQIAYISDASGEEEIYLIAQDGAGKPEQLTTNGAGMRYQPAWSPDGKHLAFSDKDGKVFVLTLEDRNLRQIADETRGQVQDYVWSPDGKYLAFSLSVAIVNRSIHIWSSADNQLHPIGGEMFDEYSPAWSADGEYLFFFSNREFAPQISTTEWNFATDRQTGIFALALKKDGKHPFPPESDEVKTESEDKKDAEKPEDKKADEKKEIKPVVIDFQGLAQRVARVPVDADNYAGLMAIKDHLLYIRTAAFYYGREAATKPDLKIFSLKERKEETLADDLRGYALSQDGAKILARHPSGFALYEAKLKGKESKKAVSTKNLMVDSVPEQEWRTVFSEVWRRFRDFFYVENMHGYDWPELRKQYEPWLGHVAHRSDLNYVMGEMVSELNVGHAYIVGGDYDTPDRPKVALLGAEIALDESAGRYKIEKILPGQNEEERYRSPLTEIGVNANEGDYILAIDGEELTAAGNPYQKLRNKSDRPVELTLNAQPSMEGSRKTQFKPITDESNLRYFAWIQSNYEKVTKLTDGKVGYLHIPDMGANGIREFIKWYYPQIRKDGLVIDVRGNGGGNVSQMIIERLRRKLLGAWFARTNDDVPSYPYEAYHGHLVALLNENSASDGDIFPARFREAGLGPLIGKRSWGGVIGITNRGPLLDGGEVFVPEFATASTTGEYIIENRGVSPDIEVENDPKSVLKGRDPQLERGVAEILEMIRKDPRPYPKRPPDPIKTP